MYLVSNNETHSISSTAPKTKLAVVGGGIASLTALFELSSDPAWLSRHDVTLYQMGWRLGGKGASGRNLEHADRIEEHGLHVWFGGYHNAFRMLRACYEALGRSADHPLADVDAAFTPATEFTCMEKVGDAWQPWKIDMPLNGKVPGVDVAPFDLWNATLAIIETAIARFMKAYGEYCCGAADSIGADSIGADSIGAEDRAFLHRLRADAARESKIFFLVEPWLKRRLHARTVGPSVVAYLSALHASGNVSSIVPTLERIRRWLYERLPPPHLRSDYVRRAWTAIDLGCAVLTGIIRDEVLTRGFEAINQLDFRQWLAQYAHTPTTTVSSELVRVFYSVSFHGSEHHTLEAGTALQGAYRLLAGYHGAYFFRMNVGMGDVVFAPLYLVLRQRGIKVVSKDIVFALWKNS